MSRRDEESVDRICGKGEKKGFVEILEINRSNSMIGKKGRQISSTNRLLICSCCRSETPRECYTSAAVPPRPRSRGHHRTEDAIDRKVGTGRANERVTSGLAR